MSRWTDLATWAGPTPNQRSGHVECRGLVVHIAEGFYQGTISWQKNPAANVSSHFVVDRDGTIAQVVDTDDTAWTQILGNGHWLSVECAGFTTGSAYHSEHPGWESLTSQQIDAIARLLLRGHQQYGYPLQLATSPSGKGLGHHSMGAESGVNWGHSDCPGEPIKAQKPAILARALQLAGDSPTSPNLEATMPFLAQTGGNANAAPGQHYLCDGFRSVPITAERAELLAYLATEGSGVALQFGRSATGDNAEWTSINGIHGIVRMGWTPDFGPVVADNGGAAEVGDVTAQVDVAAIAKAVNDDACARRANWT